MSTTTNATTMPLMMRRLLGGGGLRVARGRMVRTLSMRLVCQIRGGSVRAAVRCARVPSLPRRPRHGLDSTVRRWRHRQWYLQRYRWKCLRRDLLLSTMRLPASDRRGRRGGGLAVRGLVGAQHRGEALHHGGVELLGGHVAELLHRGAVVNHHLVAAANRIGSGHARDGAPAPPVSCTARAVTSPAVSASSSSMKAAKRRPTATRSPSSSAAKPACPSVYRQTLSRPYDLASSSAASAAPSTPSLSTADSGKAATPIDIVTRTVSWPMSMAATEARMRSASVRASSSAVRGRMITNSSPP